MYIYKEGNGVADIMVSVRLGLSDFTWWYGHADVAVNSYNRNLNHVSIKSHARM